MHPNLDGDAKELLGAAVVGVVVVVAEMAESNFRNPNYSSTKPLNVHISKGKLFKWTIHLHEAAGHPPKTRAPRRFGTHLACC